MRPASMWLELRKELGTIHFKPDAIDNLKAAVVRNDAMADQEAAAGEE